MDADQRPLTAPVADRTRRLSPSTAVIAADLKRHSAAAWSRIETGTTKAGMSTNGYLVIRELGMARASCWNAGTAVMTTFSGVGTFLAPSGMNTVHRRPALSLTTSAT